MAEVGESGRSVSSDYLQSMRFHVVVSKIGDYFPLIVPGSPDAGFSACSTPELTVEAVEYKEGRMIYTQKYPGNPSVSDITLSRGVARLDSSFWSWMRIVAEGALGAPAGQYRANLDIKHYHRDQCLVRPFPTTGDQVNLTKVTDNANAGRIYHCFECFPIRHKVAADLDGTSAEVSVMELDIAMESFEVEEVFVSLRD